MVYTEQQVTGWKDETVILPCESSLVPYAVFWGRVKQFDPISFDKIAQNFHGEVELFGDRYNIYNNNSVAIKELVVSDEDTYVCQVVTEKGEENINTTELRINGWVKSLISILQFCLSSI